MPRAPPGSLGSFWLRPSLASSDGESAWGRVHLWWERPVGPVGLRKPLGTLRSRTPAPGAGKTLLDCFPPSARSCLGGLRDAPQVQCLVPTDPRADSRQFPRRATQAVPALSLSLWQRDSTGRSKEGSGDAHSWMFPSPRRAGCLELGCGWLQTQPLERLWLQPPPPLLGAGSGCGSHPGVTAPEAPPAATRALHKSPLATRSPHPTGGSHSSQRRPEQSTRSSETTSRLS